MPSIAIVFAFLPATNVPDTAAIEFYPIPLPVSTYVNGTTLIPPRSINDYSQVNSVTLASQTVSFSARMTKLSVPASRQTWGSPPITGTATPDILYHETLVPLLLTLSTPFKTFGFEIQGAFRENSQFLLKLFDRAVEVGSIRKLVNGSAGALLFATNSTTNFLSRIEFASPSH